MTGAYLKKLVDKHGEDAVMILGYDDNINFFCHPSMPFKKDMIVITGDAETGDLLRVPGFIKNKKTGLKDIPVYTYRSLSDYRDLVVLVNKEDRKNVDTSDLYSF